MQEQNFEQQVRQKMDELSLLPSPPVWDKVAEEIRGKKDKRRFIIWFLPLLLLCSAITWWAISPIPKPLTIASESLKPSTQNSTKKEVKNNNPSATSNNKIVDIQATTLKRNIKEKAINLSHENSYSSDTKIKKNSISNPADSFDHRTVKGVQKEKTFKENTSFPVNETALNTIPKWNNPVILAIQDTNNISVAIQKVQIVQEQKEIEQNNIDINIDSAHVEQPTDTNKEQKKKAKNLEFGAFAQIGFSGITTGLFDGFGEKSGDLFSSPVQSGSGGQPPLPPSIIKRNLFYSVGFSARKKWGARSAFSTGLHYQYFSTAINVGTRTDSSFGTVSRNASSYYRNDNQLNDYTNQYHFITLPISYEYQLLKRLPLHLTAGVRLSRLIYSNALHYDSAANIYYQDNSLLNKNVAGLFTSLAYRLRSQKNFSLEVGPQFNYGLTPIQKTGASKKQHLYSVGISTQINF
jgi:hypothetical protein